MSGTHTCLWEYIVAAEHEFAFTRAYGPEGDWAQLFRRAPGYVRTELHRDRADPRRFVTVDYWESEPAWQAFRARFAVEYETLDAAVGRFTTHERELGCFTLVE